MIIIIIINIRKSFILLIFFLNFILSLFSSALSLYRHFLDYD